MMTEDTTFELDISMARQWQCPVLITAPLEEALAVARAIGDGGDEKEQTLPMVIWNGAAIVKAALGHRDEVGTSADEAVRVVQEVHTLSDAEQAALLLFYDSSAANGRWRIIATSSVCLFDRVRQGTFNASLFYHLNAIHLVSHSCGDSAKAAKSCCAGRTEGRPN